MVLINVDQDRLIMMKLWRETRMDLPKSIGKLVVTNDLN